MSSRPSIMGEKGNKMNVRNFFHYRIRWRYVDDDTGPVYTDPTGGATAYFKIESEDQEHTLTFAIAICSPKDNFCRRLGREIAYGRYLCDQVETINFSCPLDELYKYVNSILERELDEAYESIHGV